MDDFELELKQDFLSESTDLLEAAESAFLRLEEERSNPELLNEIFRLAHNLKGTSKAVGFDQLAELTHTAENLILKLKENELEVTDQVISVLLDFKDKVNEMVDGLKSDMNALFDFKDLEERLGAVANGEVESKSDNETEVEEPSVVEEVSEDTPLVVEAQEVAEEPLVEPSAEEVKPEPVKKAAVAKAADPDESIRAKLARIDQINNVIGELVILQTVISQRRFEFINDELSNKSIGMMNKLFKEVQELAMSLRMIPLKGVFQKMSRIVRDTSLSLDKKVKLYTKGEETEVDKTVLEKLSDPLVHIVRNAVDHGLESVDERTEAGKSPEGAVEIFAYHEGSNLVIQVTDDGKGINPEVIKNKAIEKGIITEETVLSDQEALQLIFHPGFSTKEQVSEVSGRGVGMDVVKTNIESLSGEVKLMSHVGRGSSFKIILPLTLAIIEGVIISVNGGKFVIPLTQIFEITQIKTSEIDSFSGMAKLFRLRGEVLPLFYINEKLGKKTEETSHYTVIIVKGVNYSFGVVVDDILNQQQIVIKKLGEDIRGKKGIVGSAIMADGMPALILDLYELFNADLKASRKQKKQTEKRGMAA